MQQIDLIFDFVGSPTEADLVWMSNPRAKEFCRGIRQKTKKDIRQAVPNIPEDGMVVVVLSTTKLQQQYYLVSATTANHNDDSNNSKNSNNTTDDLAADLLEKLLKFNPRQRISVVDALDHPYLKDQHRDAEV